MEPIRRRGLLASTASVGSFLFAGCLGNNEEFGAEWADVERIQLHASNDRWVGVSPEPIAEANNPTFRLIHGRQYELEWTNQDGRAHAIQIRNHEGTVIEAGETIETLGESETITFDAVFGVTTYICPHLDATMHGSIEIFTT